MIQHTADGDNELKWKPQLDLSSEGNEYNIGVHNVYKVIEFTLIYNIFDLYKIEQATRVIIFYMKDTASFL